MTNILFAIVVTLQTNVTVSDNSSGCPHYNRTTQNMLPVNTCPIHGRWTGGTYLPDGLLTRTNSCGPRTEPTEKYETIVITSITNAVHEHWKFELGRSEVSRVTKRWRNVPEKWVEAGTTNLQGQPVYALTNGLFHAVPMPLNFFQIHP